MTHYIIFRFRFESCEYVALHASLLEVALKFSRFCKMARRSNPVGPRSFTRSLRFHCDACTFQSNVETHCFSVIIEPPGTSSFTALMLNYHDLILSQSVCLTFLQ